MTTVKTPHDLLAAVPFLIGYHPSNSLVLISVKADSLEMAMRVDFPINPPHGAYALLASHLKRDHAEGALLVAYEPEGCDTGPEVLQNAADAVAAKLNPAIKMMFFSNVVMRVLHLIGRIPGEPPSPNRTLGPNLLRTPKVRRPRTQLVHLPDH